MNLVNRSIWMATKVSCRYFSEGPKRSPHREEAKEEEAKLLGKNQQALKGERKREDITKVTSDESQS